MRKWLTASLWPTRPLDFGLYEASNYFQRPFSNLLSSFSREAFGARFCSCPTRSSTARLRGTFLNLFRRDPHRVNRVADLIGKALLALAPLGVSCRKPRRPARKPLRR